MSEITQSGLLCPLRVVDEQELQGYMTRRNYLNHFNGKRPMTYPGEWMFAGGALEEVDDNLLETAVREFREETRYKGPITNIQELRETETRDPLRRRFHIEFYTATIDDTFEFVPVEGGEVIAVEWNTPRAFLDRIYSPDFTVEQIEAFKRYGLDDKRHGEHRVTKRQIPTINIPTFELLTAMTPELVAKYGTTDS
ncbi:MAG: NUDIX hydrolase [archaeon]